MLVKKKRKKKERRKNSKFVPNPSSDVRFCCNESSGSRKCKVGMGNLTMRPNPTSTGLMISGSLFDDFASVYTYKHDLEKRETKKT